MGSIANADRRDPIALRRPFHATIGLGALDASDAIHADAIDLSVSGMSVRTDMLPDVGVQMEFRFMLEDGKPIDARGEVVWTHDEGSRAGAFGVKFLAMPGDARASLRRSLEPVSKSPVAGGESKVRLHLESMDAPFRAKLRERQPGSVVVGHELSFLKLGGKVTVEGAKDNEPGVISAVDVEIDPVTQNPRLILTIDLDGGASARALRVTSVAKAPVTAALIDAARVSLPPVEAPAEPVAAKAEPVAAPVSEPGRAVDTARSEPEPARAKPTTVVQPAVAPPSAIDSSEDDFDDDAPAGPSLMERGVSAARGAWEGTRRIVTPVAAGVVGGVAALRARFQRPADMDDLDAPRSGLRPQHSPALATTSDPDGVLARKRNRRVVMYAGAAAVLTVLIIAMAISGGPSATAPHPQVAVTTDPAPAAEVVAPAPVAAAADLPAEDPVPMGAEPRVVAAGNYNLPADLQGAAHSPAGQVEGARAVVMQRRVRPSGFVPAVTPARPMAVTTTPGRGAAMGNPSVRVGTRLALRMDGPIASISGAGTRGNTISMVVPGRRSLDLAASLVRMDARILNAGVINRAAGAELTLRFRDAAPPFFAHARGNTLEVILGATPGAARRPAAAPVLRVSRR